MVTTYAATEGDSPITDINFGIVYENDDWIPTTGTAMDGSTTTTTKVLYIKDKIGEALNTTHTEKMSVYDPTSGTGLIADEEVTAGPVLLVSTGEIVEAVTVTAVPGVEANTSGQLASDTSLTYTAE